MVCLKCNKADCRYLFDGSVLGRIFPKFGPYPVHTGIRKLPTRPARGCEFSSFLIPRGTSSLEDLYE